MDIILKYFSDFTDKQVEQFKTLDELYKQWNAKINVISRKDIDSLYEKHVLHSLSIAAVFDFPAGTEIIDIGTGGGFPGVPLAIFFPDVKFHLVDSIGKKLKIIEAVKKEIGLTNITTQHSRAEDITGRKFDFAVSRAVAPLKELWSWSRPLLRSKQLAVGSKQPVHKADKYIGDKKNITGAGLICLKGGDLKNEIAESGLKPRMIEVSNIFEEEFFAGKYLLYTAFT